MISSEAASFMVSLGQLAIACAVGYIAWRQWKTAHDKLKLDLFEKRFAIWTSVQEFLNDILHNMDVDHPRISHFVWETNNAKFLFGSEVDEYLELIRKKAIDLISINRLRRQEAPQIESNTNQKDSELLDWFVEQSNSVSVKKFKKYFQFTK
jgi:hypothetical protein